MTLTTLPARVLRIFGSALLPLCTAGQALGLGLAWAGRDDLAAITWVVPSGIVGARLAWSILRDLLAREAGVDVIAVLAIGGALAMEEAFAAAVIALTRSSSVSRACLSTTSPDAFCLRACG